MDQQGIMLVNIGLQMCGWFLTLILFHVIWYILAKCWYCCSPQSSSQYVIIERLRNLESAMNNLGGQLSASLETLASAAKLQISRDSIKIKPVISIPSKEEEDTIGKSLEPMIVIQR